MRTDDGGNVPFYARISTIGTPDQIFHGDQWAVIVFYRPPECVPDDFNLLGFFDFPGPSGPGAFGCNPPTTDGFNLWRMTQFLARGSLEDGRGFRAYGLFIEGTLIRTDVDLG